MNVTDNEGDLLPWTRIEFHQSFRKGTIKLAVTEFEVKL